MTTSLDITEPQTTDRSRRAERAHRILDAAATLILRWGYNKTTVDDIARQAGVAKGTIYLHWKTREELFATLMRREKLAMNLDIAQGIAADPAGATLRGVLKHSALALVQRPLIKAVFLRDMDIVGKLVQREERSTAFAERLAGFTFYLQFLREHGLVRTDQSLPAQIYMVSAIFLGFFVADTLVPEEVRVGDEAIADLLAETVHKALEVEHQLSDDDRAQLNATFQGYVERAIARAQADLQQTIG